jgi:hypothetical protein
MAREAEGLAKALSMLKKKCQEGATRDPQGPAVGKDKALGPKVH